jgi:SAM-dependent methyltransferase
VTELLHHYIARGAEPWNVSTEAAWLDFQLRAWVGPRLPRRRPLRACNVGIGVGLWDDWLGHTLGAGAQLVSVDRDPDVCRVFELRQQLERHPHAARVVCADALYADLGRFDVVTCVGSALAENGARRGALEAALANALAPGGVLLIGDVMFAGDAVPAGAELRQLDDIVLAFRAIYSDPSALAAAS